MWASEAWRRRAVVCGALLAALAITSCNSVRIQNEPLKVGASNQERRTIVPTDPDRPLILITFSGGGTRAAALAESLLGELRDTTYVASDGRHSLADDVQVISSVSGGSVTAAWFGLHRAENLEELRRRFLAQDNMADLKANLVDPTFWFRLGFTSYSRIDALEHLLDKKLFGNATFGDINQPGHPFVVLNASDMAGGESFGFTPGRYDDICSNFDREPISIGVAASAAFPVLLTPVNLKDYSQNTASSCAGSVRDARWAEAFGASATAPQLDLTAYRNARYTNDLRHRDPVFRDIRYLHLLDGGVADNLGIGAVRAMLTNSYDETGLLSAIGSGYVRKLVVIVVNARSDPPSDLYQSGTGPGEWDQLQSVTSVPIDSASQNAQIVLRDLLTELARMPLAKGPNRFASLKVYGVLVDFDAIPTDTPAHRKLRDDAKSIPTTWTLSADQLQETEDIGRFLLSRDGCYAKLRSDLQAKGGVSASQSECFSAIHR